MSALPSVLLAEPDQPTRAGLRVVLERGGVDVTSEAAVAIALAERPDVAIIAAELPGGGLEATREIAAAAPRVRVVFLTGEPSGEELVMPSSPARSVTSAETSTRIACRISCVRCWRARSHFRAGIRSTWWTRSGGKTCGVGVSPRGPMHG